MDARCPWKRKELLGRMLRITGLVGKSQGHFGHHLTKHWPKVAATSLVHTKKRQLVFEHHDAPSMRTRGQLTLLKVNQNIITAVYWGDITWGVPKMVVPNNQWVFLLNMIILGCEMGGNPPFKETPTYESGTWTGCWNPYTSWDFVGVKPGPNQGIRSITENFEHPTCGSPRRDFTFQDSIKEKPGYMARFFFFSWNSWNFHLSRPSTWPLF